MKRTRPDRLIARKIALARLAIMTERAMSAFWPATMIAGAGLLYVLSGIAGQLPIWMRLTVAVILSASFVAALWQARRLKFPTYGDGVSRIETGSGTLHRPLSAVLDRLGGDAQDPRTLALWSEHRHRAFSKLRGLRAGWPRSPIAKIDPIALRNGLAILLVSALVLGWSDFSRKLAETVQQVERKAVLSALDAWIVPPAYTGKAPILLAGGRALRSQETTGERSEPVNAPSGSKLVVRVTGGSHPSLEVPGGPAGSPKVEELQQAASSGTYESETVLETSGIVRVLDSERVIAEWPVAMIADAPPVVTVTGEIERSATGSFVVPWEASDDYGVQSVGGEIRLAESAKSDKSHRAPLQFDPPDFSVTMSALNPRKADGRAFQDLTQHPWAGLEVDLNMVARDQAGQAGRSNATRFILPERQFRKLLARALIEQRRNLVFHPDMRMDVVKAISALMAWPEGLITDSGPYLGMRLAARHIYKARNDDDLREAVGLLWDIAVAVEDGDLDQALKELEALRKELQEALATGASPERLAELMAKLREALDRYLEAVARQIERALKDGDSADLQQLPQGQTIRPQDLQRMLDAIENLARSGARDAAQEMLSQLEELLKNLRPGLARRGEPQRNTPLGRMLEQLGELMRRQQQLMDDTFQLPRGLGEQPGNQPESAEPGGRGTQELEGRLGGLTGRQGQLQRMLERLMRELSQQGLNAPQGLNRSGPAMEGAENALRQGKRGQALSDQGEALEGLREGARDMAQQLMQQGTGNEGNYGRHGEARGDQRDPLGRPMPRTGEDFGPERDMVPSEAAVEKARRILEALRSKANNPSRPKIELDYIDRLLRGLY